MGVKHAFESEVEDGPDDTQVRPSNWNADHTIDGDVAFAGFKPTGLGAPTNPGDAATKSYVDGRTVPGNFLAFEVPFVGGTGDGGGASDDYARYHLDLDALGVALADEPIINFQWFLTDGTENIRISTQFCAINNAGNWDKTGVNSTIQVNGNGEAQSIPSSTQIRLLALYDNALGAMNGHLKISVNW